MERFKKISNAYEVLSDEELKNKYDKLRNESQNARAETNAFSRSGYAHKKSKSKSDNFYGDFKSKEEFYDFFTGSNKSYRSGNDEEKKYSDFK